MVTSQRDGRPFHLDGLPGPNGLPLSIGVGQFGYRRLDTFGILRSQTEGERRRDGVRPAGTSKAAIEDVHGRGLGNDWPDWPPESTAKIHGIGNC